MQGIIVYLEYLVYKNILINNIILCICKNIINKTNV